MLKIEVPNECHIFGMNLYYKYNIYVKIEKTEGAKKICLFHFAFKMTSRRQEGGDDSLLFVS
jgi:hypothetical protein